MKTRALLHITIFLVVMGMPALAAAQTCTAASQILTDYVEARVCEILKARVVQTDTTKQAAPPAAAANSTSLVERSSAPDLLGLGLDFLSLSDASGADKTATPKSMTFSAYALKSAFSNEDPLDPEIYNRNQAWRSVSFTGGYEVQENSNNRNPVIGFKWLVQNGRDVSSPTNQEALRKVQEALDNSAIGFSTIRDDVMIYLFSLLQKQPSLLPPGVTLTTKRDFSDNIVSDVKQFEPILKSLSDQQKKNIDEIISKNIGAFAALDAATKKAVQAIRTQPQFGLAFTTVQRKDSMPDEYSGVLTYDKGFGNNSIAVNASFIFKDYQGKDSKGGQFAASLNLPLKGYKPLEYTGPMLFSLEAAATGMTGVSPVYKAQAKLTIPLVPGMELPISVSVASRGDTVADKEVKGKFGLTFDLSKAMKAFQDGFQKRQ